MSSKELKCSPAEARNIPSSSSAAAGCVRPSSAVALLRILGQSLSVAAVITPSVPSDPISSDLRS